MAERIRTPNSAWYILQDGIVVGIRDSKRSAQQAIADYMGIERREVHWTNGRDVHHADSAKVGNYIFTVGRVHMLKDLGYELLPLDR